MGMRKAVELVGLLVSLAGLAINSWIIVGSLGTASAINGAARGLPDTLVYFWSYYTHLTNLWLVLIYLGLLTGWSWLRPLLRPAPLASAAGNIALVMLFYHFMLAPNYHFTGGLLIANGLMHYVAPLLYLGWWAVFAPHGTLRYRDVPVMLTPGLVYLAYILIRGAFAHEYPYDILDVAARGYGRVAIGVAVLIVLVALFCAIGVLADRRLARRKAVA
jgi:hypothetical protein